MCQVPTASLSTAPRTVDIADPQECTHRSELIEEAQRARESMERLKLEERRVLELAVYGGLSQNQIAVQMNMPLGTVKTHSRRGLIRLRELLGSGREAASKGAQQ